jgi:peptide/nickel transport system permease protein
MRLLIRAFLIPTNELMEKQPALKQDYWSYVKRQFSKNKRAVFSAYVVGFMALIAVFADFIANEKPLVAKYNDEIYFPIFREYAVNMGLARWPQGLQNINWITTEFEFAIRPLIPYSPTTQDLFNAQYQSPVGSQMVESIRWRHWLGTEKIGRDVLAALVHGTRIAFQVGIVSMSIATFIGIIMGAMAGFFGDSRLRISRIRLWITLALFIFAFFWGFSSRSYILSDAMGQSFFLFLFQFLVSIAIFFGVLGIGWVAVTPLKKIAYLGEKVQVPVDIIVLRIIEILVSIPQMFLIIAIVAIAKPSIFLVMAVIGLTSWTGIARFIRAELLRVRSLEYIEAADALGFSNMRILLRHAIPNSLSPVLITVAFGIASAILIEAFLSFIGIGIPPEVLTWGKLLSFARNAPSAWWLAIFPGFAIFITVTMFNLIGEGLTDALDPRQKR